MNYKLINEKLKDIPRLRSGKCIEKSSKAEYDYSEHYEIYELGDGLFIRFDIYSDSYGEDSTIRAISFVQPKEVTVTNFVNAE